MNSKPMPHMQKTRTHAKAKTMEDQSDTSWPLDWRKRIRGVKPGTRQSYDVA